MIKRAVQLAIEKRSHAISFRTAVGASIITKDGQVFSGFNIEAYGYNFELHAEQMAVINGMQAGYHGTDYDTIVVLYQEGWGEDPEIYPCCPYCWAFLNLYTNLDLKIINSDINGNIMYETTLGECIRPPAPAGLYPSEKKKKLKPLIGMEPKLK